MIARVLWRAGRVIEHLATGTAVALYAKLHRAQEGPSWLPRAVQWWYRRLLCALGVEVRVKGQPESRCLMVSNHISWLDIPVLGAQGEISFLSKAEVRRWPLIGWLAELVGTRFIERGAHRSAAVLRQLQTDLEAGHTIMLFPEGTTTDGRAVGPFYPRLFALAQATGVPIQPVALRYCRSGDPRPDPIVPYVGDDTLVANLWRLLRHPGLIAEVHFLLPFKPQAGQSRRALAEQARAAILAALETLDRSSLTLTAAADGEPSTQIEPRAA